MRTIEERFWSKVSVGAPDACWPWLRSQRPGGYGQFRIRPGESPQRAPRVAWWLTFGENPGPLKVCHRCDNPPCVNPAHLFLGTTADNTADMIAKGRAGFQRHGRAATAELVAYNRRLSGSQLAEALRRHEGGESCRSIARDFGCSHTTISRLASGQHWPELQQRSLPS